ncbi:MAG TPA: helix-turn-helix domain-containing protein [Empedobacter falsenii]|nr:helix-turn-helix domain-containing protein [Empedobacter falsenii]
MESFNVFDQEEFIQQTVENKRLKKDLIQTIFIRKGSLKILQNDQEINLNKHDVFFPEPNKSYQIISKSTDLELLSLVLTKKILDTSIIDLSGYEYNQFFASNKINNYHFNEIEFSALVELLLQLKNRLKEKPTKFVRYIQYNLFYAIVYTTFSELSKQQTIIVRKGTRKDEIVKRFLVDLNHYYTENRDAKFYADKLNITVRYLTECCKSITGRTTKELISSVVIRQAKVLLSETTKTISEISNELNFSDQYSFGNFFKKQLKISPTQFRKNLQ